MYDSTALRRGGLEPAGTILRSTHPDLVVSKQKLRRAEVIQLVREKRETANQTLGFASRPFVLCGLPVKRPRPGTRVASRNGVDLKSLTFEPVLHSIQIVCGESKPTTEFFRREPLVKSGRGGILLIGDQPHKRRGLRRGRLEMQLNAVYPMVFRQRSAILCERGAGISGPAQWDCAVAFQASPQPVLRLRHRDRFNQK